MYNWKFHVIKVKLFLKVKVLKLLSRAVTNQYVPLEVSKQVHPNSKIKNSVQKFTILLFVVIAVVIGKRKLKAFNGKN